MTTSIGDVARDTVVTARPDTSAADLARVMHEESVGSVVVEADRRPVGIVTDRDLSVRLLPDATDPREAYARDLMTGDPYTIERNAGVFATTRLMQERSIRRVPVVDGAGELVGIVTMDDLHRYLISELSNLSSVVAAESPPY